MERRFVCAGRCCVGRGSISCLRSFRGRLGSWSGTFECGNYCASLTACLRGMTFDRCGVQCRKQAVAHRIMKSSLANTKSAPEPLAIVGIGCLFPRADSLESFWSNVKHGVDAIREIPASHWRPEDYFDEDAKQPDMTYARRGGFLDAIEFDP